MSYLKELLADVERRFEKIVRDQAVLDAVPVTELSDAELAHQLARNAATKSIVSPSVDDNLTV